jgi:hypothetical protein
MKKVIFISGESGRLEQRLQRDNPKYKVISADYENLLEESDLKQIKDVFYATKIDPERPERYKLSHTRKRFGDLLRDPDVDLIIIRTANLSKPYLAMYEDEAKNIHSLSAKTLTIVILMDTPAAVETDTQKDFFFICGTDTPAFADLITNNTISSIYIGDEDINVVNKEYIKAMNNHSLELIAMNATKFSSEDKAAFRRFPPSDGYSVQNIKIAKDLNEDAEPYEPSTEEIFDSSESEGNSTEQIPEETKKGKKNFWDKFKNMDLNIK